MFGLNNYRIRSLIVGVVAAMVLGSGNVRADFTFGEPVNLGPPVNTPYNEVVGCFSADGLTMYFSSAHRPGTILNWDIWVSRRDTIDDEWITPVNLGPTVNSFGLEQAGSISSDGLQLYFTAHEDRPGGYGLQDVWVMSRATPDDPWNEPVNLGSTINGSFRDFGPSISSDGLELYFASNRTGGYGYYDIWVSTRTTTNDPWAEPTNLGPVVNSSASETYPCLSDDGRLLLFNEDDDPATPKRPGGYGGSDNWMTTRASVSAPWGTPVNLGPIVNSPSNDGQAVLSHDGSSLYFSSARPGGLGGTKGDIYQAPIIPVVDFNGDKIVDAEDMCIMVDHWGTDYSLCDIGPMPWGDGVVDVEDLVILSEHLFEEVDDPTLVAHWPLDEAEGMVVADGTGGNDGYALGDPVWLHDGGQINGALQLDGVDDYVVTGAAPNPEGNSYSVLAWMKGGAPGQVVLSQMDKADWLCANPSAGTLMTELTMAGRGSSSLGSQAVITDGNWHRIGFVWDGSYRRLYVDGVVVAEDVQDNLDVSSNGLYFGTGKTMEPGTFFSGLIDDVRIYNRAVSP
ncbi:LamG-like jellyroll fold domain-containing protein [Planctomycetota bacterium]